MSETTTTAEQSDFDVDAWLEDAKPPQRAVPLYGRPDLLSTLQDLIDQRKHDTTPPTIAGNPIDAKIRRLKEQITASRRVFHVRGLLLSERNALAERFTTTETVDGESQEKFDAPGYEAAAMAQSMVDPVLTEAQAARLHIALGDAQWMNLVRALEAASTEQVDVPLLRLDSETTQDS